MVAGSPAYMAPDMREADEATGPKADVFSAGIVMIEVASGRQPNPGPDMRRQGRMRVGVPEEELPSWVREVFERAAAAGDHGIAKI